MNPNKPSFKLLLARFWQTRKKSESVAGFLHVVTLVTEEELAPGTIPEPQHREGPNEKEEGGLELISTAKAEQKNRNISREGASRPLPAGKSHLSFKVNSDQSSQGTRGLSNNGQHVLILTVAHKSQFRWERMLGGILIPSHGMRKGRDLPLLWVFVEHA